MNVSIFRPIGSKNIRRRGISCLWSDIDRLLWLFGIIWFISALDWAEAKSSLGIDIASPFLEVYQKKVGQTLLRQSEAAGRTRDEVVVALSAISVFQHTFRKVVFGPEDRLYLSQTELCDELNRIGGLVRIDSPHSFILWRQLRSHLSFQEALVATIREKRTVDEIHDLLSRYFPELKVTNEQSRSLLSLSVRKVHELFVAMIRTGFRFSVEDTQYLRGQDLNPSRRQLLYLLADSIYRSAPAGVDVNLLLKPLAEFKEKGVISGNALNPMLRLGYRKVVDLILGVVNHEKIIDQSRRKTLEQTIANLGLGSVKDVELKYRRYASFLKQVQGFKTGILNAALEGGYKEGAKLPMSRPLEVQKLLVEIHDSWRKLLNTAAPNGSYFGNFGGLRYVLQEIYNLDRG